MNGSVHGHIKGKNVLVKSQALVSGGIEKKDPRVEQISTARASELEALPRLEQMTRLAEPAADVGYAKGHNEARSNVKGLPVGAK